MALELLKPFRASINLSSTIDLLGDLLLECRELALILKNPFRILKLLFKLIFSTLAC